MERKHGGKSRSRCTANKDSEQSHFTLTVTLHIKKTQIKCKILHFSIQARWKGDTCCHRLRHLERCGVEEGQSRPPSLDVENYEIELPALVLAARAQGCFRHDVVKK